MAVAQKVIVIGLDGADWRLLTPWIKEGHLPTLAKLVSEGAWGFLRTSIRPESSVAWSSFSTGVNPGKHGVFGFAIYDAHQHRYRLANGSSVRVKRFWDLLGQQGRRVGLLNIPMTYPPVPVNGFMVTGMLTPGTDVAFTHPPSLQRQLLRRFEDYAFDTPLQAGDKVSLSERVRDHTIQQRDTALWLMREEPWDLFAMVFTGPDRLQHFLWSDMDPVHPLHVAEPSAGLGQELLRHYQFLDDAIEEMLRILPPETLVVLMSDHGFNACARRFHVNRWLRNEGLLKLSGIGRRAPDLVSVLAPLRSARWLRRLKRALFPGRGSSVDLSSQAFIRAIDWSGTRAYFGLDNGLRINLCGREPEGIVPASEYESFRRHLGRALLAVAEPSTGRPPIHRVFSREELYHGPFVDRAPDLVLEPHRDHADPARNFVLDGALTVDGTYTFSSSAPYSANHTLDGIVVMWGPGVLRGTMIESAKIIDMAPTILAALGANLPTEMDGRVLSEVFSPEYALVTQPAEGLDMGLSDRQAEGFGLEDEMVVERRLRGLGYLD
jgi:predicted AlkP superfamily phosphohydrolase/phosphomutase